MAVVLLPITVRAMRRSAEGSRWLRGGLAGVWAALPVHTALGEAAGLALTLLGSALLIAGHCCNLRRCSVSRDGGNGDVT